MAAARASPLARSSIVQDPRGTPSGAPPSTEKLANPHRGVNQSFPPRVPYRLAPVKPRWGGGPPSARPPRRKVRTVVRPPLRQPPSGPAGYLGTPPVSVNTVRGVFRLRFADAAGPPGPPPTVSGRGTRYMGSRPPGASPFSPQQMRHPTRASPRRPPSSHTVAGSRGEDAETASRTTRPHTAQILLGRPYPGGMRRLKRLVFRHMTRTE